MKLGPTAKQAIDCVFESTDPRTILVQTVALVQDIFDNGYPNRRSGGFPTPESTFVQAYGDFGYPYPKNGRYIWSPHSVACRFIAEEFLEWASEAIDALYSNPFPPGQHKTVIDTYWPDSTKVLTDVCERHGINPRTGKNADLTIHFDFGI